MGQHTTSISLSLIEFLIELGQTLNYHTETEFPMNSKVYGSQAIDIAWFNEEGAKFPLFIFEIESSSNNAIVNNPAKIFGKESKVFEKPLFFFHVIIDGAEYSEKYSDLMRLFGTHNYDIFKINNGEIEKLLLKIIEQHRRIHNEYYLYGILRLINGDAKILSEMDYESFLHAIENLTHDNQSYRIGQIYADVAVCDKFFEKQYFKFIRRSYLNKKWNRLSYENYHIHICSDFINLGILYCSFKDEFSNVDFKSHLIEAQKTDTFNNIAYLPGLNQDYDIFIEDYVPYYLALTFFLFEGNIDAQMYILKISFDIIKELPISDSYIIEHHTSWGLILAASRDEFSQYYNEIKEIANANEILDTILYCPTFMNDHRSYEESQIIKVPERSEYIKTFTGRFNDLKDDNKILEIAIKSLSDNWKDQTDYHFNLGVSLSNFVIKSLNKA